MAFWSENVPASTVEGLVGRFFAEALNGRIMGFRKFWDQAMVSELDAPEARRLCNFLSDDTEPTSPSASACKGILVSLFRDDADGVTNAKKPSANKKSRKGRRKARGEDEGSPSGRAIDSEGSATGERNITPFDMRSDLVLPPEAEVVGALNSGTPPSDGSDSSSSSSDSLSSSDSSDHTKTRRKARRNRRAPRLNKASKSSKDGKVLYFCHLPLYRDLPRSMRMILRQGAVFLWKMFEPLSLEVTTLAELNKLHRYSNKLRQVMGKVCRAKGLSVSPQDCESQLEAGTIRRVRPEERINHGVTFAATSRIAPMKLTRWLQHGELKTWLEAAVARAGSVHVDSQDGHLAREILSTGLVLASLMDEFHPENLLQSVEVERLVRRLVIYEKALSVDKKERGQYLIRHLSFMGLGGGATPETEHAIEN